MEFEPEEFRRLSFNVHELPAEESVIDNYGNLKMHPEFQAKLSFLDQDKVIRYIIYMYDYHTPLQKVPDLYNRKMIAADLSGFIKNEEGHYSSFVEAMLMGQNPMVNRMIIKFCILNKGSKYAMIKVSEQRYFSNLADILKEDEDVNNKFVSETRKMGEELEKAKQELLNEDNNKILVEDLYSYTEAENLGLRPEDIALKLKNGEQPFAYKEVQ